MRQRKGIEVAAERRSIFYCPALNPDYEMVGEGDRDVELLCNDLSYIDSTGLLNTGWRVEAG